MNSITIIVGLNILFPYLCLSQSPQTISNIAINFINKGTHTTFTLTSSLSGTLTNMWMGVGLNGKKIMVGNLMNCLN